MVFIASIAEISAMTDSSCTRVVILSASAGLGSYSPAADLYQHLIQHDQRALFEVLESMLTAERQDRSIRARGIYQASFQTALAAQRYLGIDDIGRDLDLVQVSKLFDKWQREGVGRFVLFSGFWLPIVERYLERCENRPLVDCLHMDSIPGHSWRRYLPQFSYPHSHQWLFDSARDLVERTVVPPALGSPIKSRNIFMHGGGWQIGDYKSSARDLKGAGYGLIIAEPNVSPSEPLSEVAYCVDPKWRPWDHDSPQAVPHLVRGGRNETWQMVDPGWFSGSIRSAAAIVSKPGGATLLDSLMFGVPLVFCTAYGDVEQANADLWVRKGFGIHIFDWKSQGYHPDVLGRMKLNLWQHHQMLARSYAESVYV